jgi:hypothetical protein
MRSAAMECKHVQTKSSLLFLPLACCDKHVSLFHVMRKLHVIGYFLESRLVSRHWNKKYPFACKYQISCLYREYNNTDYLITRFRDSTSCCVQHQPVCKALGFFGAVASPLSVPRSEYSQSLAFYWSPVQNILSPWLPIGPPFGIFSAPGFLWVYFKTHLGVKFQQPIKKQTLTDEWHATGNKNTENGW